LGTWCDELIEFYRQTDAFLYESAVWNRRPFKLKVRRWIGKYIAQLLGDGLKVLCFGDGLGFESAYLAQMGNNVTYHEVSELSGAFAKRVFDLNDVQVATATHESCLRPSEFDIVVCMDVLEHVPDPLELVVRFSEWLHGDGVLVVNAPFYLVSPQFPTHLRANRRWSGEWKQLYVKNGLYPIASGFLWSPLVLCKSKSIQRSILTRLRWRLGGTILRLGRWVQFPFLWGERIASRGDRRWAEDLQARLGREKE